MANRRATVSSARAMEVSSPAPLRLRSAVAPGPHARLLGAPPTDNTKETNHESARCHDMGRNYSGARPIGYTSCAADAAEQDQRIAGGQQQGTARGHRD